MKVFISWSGERSESLAKSLRDWLKLVLYYVEPWVSQSDIQAGERWSVEVAKELEGSNFGIICITKENMNAPWILFEAGALAKSMQEGRVIPLLLDIDFKDISGPLAQFQAKKADSNGINEIINSINKSSPSPVPDAQLEKLFWLARPEIDAAINAIPKVNSPAKMVRPQGEILEELVSGIRSVELRLRDVSEPEYNTRRRKMHRLTPRLVLDAARSIQGESGDPVAILMVSSLFRDEIPWLYELGVDAYRSARSGGRQEYMNSIRNFRKALEITLSGNLDEFWNVEKKEMYYMLREVLDMGIFYSISSTRKNSGAQRPKRSDDTNTGEQK
ncbi:toll/interleukin-1 receptor domain-containing protein [Phreatobacter sp.]|uniref:toll/interleukin-1 receptor domain-containing protein n=1 Tax=Phreatobacter sp. TaxID=1966341 RepID=UPI003F711540